MLCNRGYGHVLFIFVIPSPLCLIPLLVLYKHTPWPLTHQTIKKGRLHPQFKLGYNSFIGGTQTLSLSYPNTQTHTVTPVCLLALLLNDISSTERTWHVGGNLILHPFLSPTQRNSFILCEEHTSNSSLRSNYVCVHILYLCILCVERRNATTHMFYESSVMWRCIRSLVTF